MIPSVEQYRYRLEAAQEMLEMHPTREHAEAVRIARKNLELAELVEPEVERRIEHAALRQKIHDRIMMVD